MRTVARRTVCRLTEAGLIVCVPSYLPSQGPLYFWCSLYFGYVTTIPVFRVRHNDPRISGISQGSLYFRYSPCISGTSPRALCCGILVFPPRACTSSTLLRNTFLPRSPVLCIYPGIYIRHCQGAPPPFVSFIAQMFKVVKATSARITLPRVNEY